MRVVVIGATGNMGTAVVRALSADGFEVLGIARRPPDPALAADLGHVSFVTADIAADDLVGHLRGADAVVHLGWLFQPTHRPDITWQVNAVGSARVLAAAAEARVPTVVYASSVGAYSPGRGRTVDESWPTHSQPTAAYGREKAYVERLLDVFEAEHPDVRVVRLRPGFVFQAPAGTQQRRLFAGPFVPRSLLRPGALPVVPWPRGLRFQAVHADDLSQVYLAVLRADVRGAFNVAADPVIDVEAIGEVTGAATLEVPPSVVRAGLAAAWHARMVPADPALFDLVLSLPLMDTARVHAELGWTPAHSAIDALGEALVAMASGAGGPSAPLGGDTPARRLHEIATGSGERP